MIILSKKCNQKHAWTEITTVSLKLTRKRGGGGGERQGRVKGQKKAGKNAYSRKHEEEKEETKTIQQYILEKKTPLKTQLICDLWEIRTKNDDNYEMVMILSVLVLEQQQRSGLVLEVVTCGGEQ